MYNKTRCFETFPFPDATEVQKKNIRNIAEQLDNNRKQQQSKYSTLTTTDMYNVLEKIRSGEVLTEKDKNVNEQGLISILKQLHDELDAAVALAYGWPTNIFNEDILERLVALNKERAAEEARGLVHWLRPEYQNPQGVHQADLEMETTEGEVATIKQEFQDWPTSLAD